MSPAARSAVREAMVEDERMMPSRRSRRRSGRGGRRRVTRSQRAFRDAYRADDPVALARLLGPDVCVVVDTGGVAGAAHGPACGITAALTLLRVALGSPATLRLQLRSVNGRPGLLAPRDGRLVAVIVVDGRAAAVDHVWVVTNPEKLATWSLGSAIWLHERSCRRRRMSVDLRRSRGGRFERDSAESPTTRPTEAGRRAPGDIPRTLPGGLPVG